MKRPDRLSGALMSGGAEDLVRTLPFVRHILRQEAGPASYRPIKVASQRRPPLRYLNCGMLLVDKQRQSTTCSEYRRAGA